MNLTPDSPDVPEIEGVFDLAARRDANMLRTENEALKGKLEEALRERLLPSIDHVASLGTHGRSGGDSRCQFHLAVLVDESKWEVVCRWCGEELDATRVLLEFAKKERMFCNNLEWAKRERRELHEENEKLKKERKNLRAAVLTAKKRLTQLKAQAGERDPRK